MDKPPVEPEHKCERCSKPTDGEKHTCPYAEEINGDSESLCTCCPDCVHDCAMDI